MAVIITNMDMPETCEQCKYPECALYKISWYTNDNDSLNYTTERHRRCPLKSADEMIKEIADVYVGYRHAYEVKAEILDIIHKYIDN